MNQVDLDTAYAALVTAQKSLTEAALAKARAKYDLEVASAKLTQAGLEGGNAEARNANLTILTEAERKAELDANETYEVEKMDWNIANAEVERLKWGIRLSILNQANSLGRME